MIGFSADGDSRLLNTMKNFTKFCLRDRETLFLETHEPEFVCFQDTIHVGNKGRNRALKMSIVLPMGNKIVSISHLKILINNVPKEVHGLVVKDVCPDDRQNFKSLQKVMMPRVLNALTEYVDESQATVMYFGIYSEITSSMLDLNISPLERVYKIWFAAYFIRIWRIWIKNMQKNQSNIKYSLSDNFISPNSYACVEINAHNIIKIIRKLRCLGLPELFHPNYFSSQPCEETFRQLRSMGTMNFTKINFTLLEVFHLIGRVELQNDIIYSKLAEFDSISFPRNKINPANTCKHLMPADDEIRATMVTAYENAIKKATQFDMKVQFEDALYSDIIDIHLKNSTTRKRKFEEIYLEEGRNDDLIDKTNYSDYNEDIEESTPFIEIENTNGTKKKIRKSTYVWYLTDFNEKLGNDRLKRVQTSSNKTSCKRRLNFDRPTQSKNISNVSEIQIGDWCIFKNNKTNPELILGVAVGFKYINGANEKEKQYTWDFAPVECDLPDEKKRGINVLASWYRISTDGILERFGDANCFHVDIQNYCATLFNLKFDEPGSFDKAYFKSIESEIKKFDVTYK